MVAALCFFKHNTLVHAFVCVRDYFSFFSSASSAAEMPPGTCYCCMCERQLLFLPLRIYCSSGVVFSLCVPASFCIHLPYTSTIVCVYLFVRMSLIIISKLLTFHFAHLALVLLRLHLLAYIITEIQL